MLWGHGSFRTSYGYFKVPANMRIEFFIEDNQALDDGAIRKFEFGDLSNGVGDDLVKQAAKVQKVVQRVVKGAGAAVKNYKLESIIGDFLASGAKNALKNDNVWTPGKETGDGEEVTDLVGIVRDHAHLGSAMDPMVLQWCACTSNYIGEDESAAPVARGKKIKISNANGSRCYISTATCSALGLPDDCEPLLKLRRFRDTFLLASPGGAADVAAYYRTAPAIVRAIERGPGSQAVYREIFDRHIVPALAAIDDQDHAAAYRIYKDMVASLTRQS
jgi:hypothetical protein